VVLSSLIASAIADQLVLVAIARTMSATAASHKARPVSMNFHIDATCGGKWATASAESPRNVFCFLFLFAGFSADESARQLLRGAAWQL
jgi:hypothetical protein